MNIWFAVGAATLFFVSGLPWLVLFRWERLASWLAVLLMAAGFGVGVAAVATTLAGSTGEWSMAWRLPLGRFSVGVDGLALVFLLPVLLVPLLGSWYGLGYWRPAAGQEASARLPLFYGCLAGSMVLLVVARDGMLFLMAWEVMALSAFFLVTVEDDDPAARRAGWVYLVATHLGTLCLLAMFALIHRAGGSLALGGAIAVSRGQGTAIFILALIGFGLKAGLAPLHFWLPAAHANAPSHVSAVLSGVMLKMGVYGLVRITGMLPDVPAAWGATLLVLGTLSALGGILLAVVQHDLKRTLAYSSIENIGIVAMGLGIALLGRAHGATPWVVLGLGGALLHVWNHSLFKPLLFLGAGSIVHGMKTRQIDRMGGLARHMPATSLAFLVGALAICGLPPLNGLVSEMAIYLGLFSTVGVGSASAAPMAALAVPALGMVGALAVVAMVRLFGTIFLGEPRTSEAARVHEAPASMVLPMAVLASGCFLMGLAPMLATPIVDRAIATWTGQSDLPTLSSLMPLGPLALCSAAVLLAAVGGTGWLRLRAKACATRDQGTWDCGYAAPTARMQYTGSSMAQFIQQLFRRVLTPKLERLRLTALFPKPAAFASRPIDLVYDRIVLPAAGLVQWGLARLQGAPSRRVEMHILYILVVMLALVAAATWGVLASQ